MSAAKNFRGPDHFALLASVTSQGSPGFLFIYFLYAFWLFSPGITIMPAPWELALHHHHEAPQHDLIHGIEGVLPFAATLADELLANACKQPASGLHAQGEHIPGQALHTLVLLVWHPITNVLFVVSCCFLCFLIVASPKTPKQRSFWMGAPNVEQNLAL